MTHERLERFVALSVEATGFTAFELRGTGVAEEYLATLVGVVGEAMTDELLDRYDEVLADAGGTGRGRQELLRRELLSDPRLGPLARNVAKMWFVGIWYELPRAWTELCGPRDGDVTRTVSGTAYTEGLLWPAIGANPPGAKAPGYGSWAHAPRIPAAK